LTAGFGNQFSPTNAVFLQSIEDQQFAAQNAALIADGLPPLPPSDEPVVPRGSAGFWQIQAVTTFTLPLIDYGQRHAERANDTAALASAENALVLTQSQAALDVHQNYRGAQTALAQLQYAKEEARLGIEAARIAQLQYQNGLIAFSDVSQAEQTSITAQSDLINARVSYVDAVVKLRTALGIFDAQSAVADLT
jgi:outer membrane protein TolC